MLFGWFVNNYHPDWVANIRPFSQIFLRMIKMIIAPLIFATLVAGIAGAGHFRQVGRMGLKAIIYFEIVTTIALVIGLVAVNLTQPGRRAAAADRAERHHRRTRRRWREILLHLVPESVIQAMATGDVLQIVVFSIIFGIALGMIGEKGKPMVHVLRAARRDDVQVHEHRHALRADRRRRGDGVHGRPRRPRACSRTSGLLVLTLYGALIVLLPGRAAAGRAIFKVPIRKFIRAVREPAIIAFSTTSSEAALPRAMEVLERLGVPRRIVSFILPLGYSFNLDGTTLYLSLAAVFVAQAAGVELTIGQQITMLLTLMLTSKGVAGVPRASLVILAGTLASYDLPLVGITLILGVDELMDMARTMTNVVGNCLATVVIAKWEGEFKEASDAELDAAAAKGEI